MGILFNVEKKPPIVSPCKLFNPSSYFKILTLDDGTDASGTVWAGNITGTSDVELSEHLPSANVPLLKVYAYGEDDTDYYCKIGTAKSNSLFLVVKAASSKVTLYSLMRVKDSFVLLDTTAISNREKVLPLACSGFIRKTNAELITTNEFVPTVTLKFTRDILGNYGLYFVFTVLTGNMSYSVDQYIDFSDFAFKVPKSIISF